MEELLDDCEFMIVLEEFFNAIYLLNSINTKLCVVATQNSIFFWKLPLFNAISQLPIFSSIRMAIVWCMFKKKKNKKSKNNQRHLKRILNRKCSGRIETFSSNHKNVKVSISLLLYMFKNSLQHFTIYILIIYAVMSFCQF